MKETQKATETFVVKVMKQQNATWQGSVLWVDKQKEQHFRSALELIKLLDGALENDTDNPEDSKK